MHIDHGNRVPTPFISFTTSPWAFKDLADKRKVNRESQSLIVVDPKVRQEAGLPILDVLAEVTHYGIGDLYGNGYRYCRNHYVCLWEVSGEELVGRWHWDELDRNPDWYNEIVMPAFREFRRNNAAKQLTWGKLHAMVTAKRELACRFQSDQV
jgi:hypothetical protein